jgi:glycosyltransferase involved in cell wall biosynthesis
MHILEIPSFFTPYGGEFCLEQARALKALGHEVRILSNVQLGITVGGKDYMVLPFTRFEHERGGITICQSYQRGLPHMARHNAKRWIGIVLSMFDEYVQKYGKPDILHAHCARWAGYAAMKISKQYGMPYVITEHLPKEVFETVLGKVGSSAWQIPPLKEAYNHANMVITVSEELVDDLACYFGKDYRHVTIPNVIDTRFYSFGLRKPIGERAFAFCCPAIFNHRKGYDVLFEAFAKLVETEPNVVLHIAGQGTDGKACRNMIDSYGVGDKVICHGQIDANDMRELYHQSDAMVLATRGETQGLVIAEAMSTGIPAISTEGIPASMRLDCGYSYVPVNDAKALAIEMLKALKNPITESDGRSLSQMIAERFSPNVIGAKIAEVMTCTLPRI